MELNQTAARQARAYLDAHTRTDWSYPTLPPPRDQSDEELSRAVALRGRVDSTERAHGLVDAAAEALGGLDLLVSNAASGVLRPAMEATERHWDWTLDTNARALLLLAQRAAPLMEAQGGGAMVAISSLGSNRVLENYVLVGVSKAALEACVRYLGVELAPRGIRVNVVAPGLTLTPRIAEGFGRHPDPEQYAATRAASVPLGRLAEPREIAEPIFFLASPAASYITGAVLPVDGGYTAA